MAGRGIIDERYINTLSADALRRELVDALEFQFGLIAALKELPDLPPPFVLQGLSRAASYPDHWNLGKQMQRTASIEALPPNAECELGAGLWSILRAALVADAEKRKT